MCRQKGGAGQQIGWRCAAEGKFRKDDKPAGCSMGPLHCVAHGAECGCEITDERVGLNEGDLHGNCLAKRVGRSKAKNGNNGWLAKKTSRQPEGRRVVQVREEFYSLLTFAAAGPLGPSTISN